MRIAVIGSGNVGGALARSFIRAGHEVVVGTRFPLSDKSVKLAALIGEDKFMPAEEAAGRSEVIVITTPPLSVFSVIPQLGEVKNKVIIDASNSVRGRPEPYATVFHALKEITGSDKVVKCFNTTGFENMLDPVYKGQGIDMFCAGNNAEAKDTAKQLALSIGFGACHDFGGDDKVELLEQLALSWINLAIMQGLGRGIALKVVKR